MNERKNIDIDIIASCVCRDAFVIGAPAVAINRYTVRSNFQYNSILSYMSKRNESLAAITEEEFCFGSPWQRRMLSADLKKDIFDKIYADNSYIILDLTSTALKHFDISDSEVSLFTSNKVSRPNLEVLEKILGYTPKKIDPWDLDKDFVKDAAERYAEKVAAKFPAGKIIFTEVLNSTEFITKDGILAQFEKRQEIDKKNAFLCELKAIVCEKLEKLGSPAIIVPMPEGVLGYELHKWGKYSLHFCDEYYEYLLRAYDTICSGCTAKDTVEIISELKAACESRFVKVRERAIEKAAYLKEKENHEKELLKATHSAKDIKNKIATLKKKYKTDNLGKYIAELTKQNKQLEKEISDTHASISYKIGRFITFIPRKILRKK